MRYILPGTNTEFSGVGLLDVFSTGVVVEGANLFPTEAGAPSTLIDSYGQGHVAFLPFDPGQLVLDRRKSLKSFYSRSGTFPAERVSRVSKGTLRVFVRTLLEHLYHRRGLPFCHLWYFPDGMKDIFGLRIDSDFANSVEIDDLYRRAEDHGLKMNWYLHVQAHEGWIDRFSQMKGHEIGVHCYEHAVLKTRFASRKDLSRAVRLIEGRVSEVFGVAAPFGEWNDELGSVIEDLGFLYSSEFSYDYDNIPSYPVIRGRHIGTMQIPIHPICIGSFKRLGVSDSEMIQYFDSVVRSKQIAHEPLFFYHHPKDGRQAVLDHIMNIPRKLNAESTIFLDFAVWWKEREAARFEIEMTADRVVVHGSVSPRVSLRVVRNGDEAIVPFGDVNLADVRWSPKVPGDTLPMDIDRIRSFSFPRMMDSLRAVFRRSYK